MHNNAKVLPSGPGGEPTRGGAAAAARRPGRARPPLVLLLPPVAQHHGGLAAPDAVSLFLQSLCLVKRRMGWHGWKLENKQVRTTRPDAVGAGVFCRSPAL